ncbi:MAG: hypothetical protein KDE54_23930 [Caldilineaceae bacterium]|nr:hypothetical protein [Caldilineaceae bacterium]MCB0099206.1 hypothetical protein [Caldilineaceae bacterium]MCB0142689.1 hypothetical protein [Caldilineaceae bacterium]MCB9148250.1 hypothetical protein [Caldilineaceae bacterium]MCB9156056.1 hypothetical protein [Caldilineaceae bacterium]
MTTVYIESTEEQNVIQQLIRSAIESEINRLELALGVAHKRIEPFEKKYGVTSKFFIEEMSAEELDGRDDEYVHWAGEYKLTLRLQDKLSRLKEINYGDPNILRRDQRND